MVLRCTSNAGETWNSGATMGLEQDTRSGDVTLHRLYIDLVVVLSPRSTASLTARSKGRALSCFS